MMKKIKKMIEVDHIEFDDGFTIETRLVYGFINKFWDNEWIKTIDCDHNWTDDYIYFNKHEKEFEQRLLKYDVIRLSPYYKDHNDRVAKGDKYYDEYRYWLSKGFHQFIKKYYEN